VSIDSEALAIYQAALALDSDEARAAFIDAQCGDNAVLRARVERMVAYDGTGVELLPEETLSHARADFTAIPERLGPYRVTGEIARGGMGMVVRAEREDGVYDQTVAIKLIRGDIASAKARMRFDMERRILARLVHPAIVRILDGGDADGTPWLAMDLVDGLPVTEQLHEAGLSGDAVLGIFLAICDAVAFAHSKLVVHADIKPSNVLLTAEHEVRVVDFGISRLIVELDVHETGTTYPLTRTYAAPERTQGGAPTIASDVYSLGILLREMWHANAADAPMPRELAAIVARATALDPQARYVDVTSLASDIRRFRAHVPVSAIADPGGAYRARLFLRRHRVGVTITGAIMAILMAAAAFSTAQYLRAEHERTAADQRFADVRGTAHYLLYGLMPRLEATRDSIPFRVEVASVAQHYLDRLAGAPQASDDLRLEAAEGLTTLAEM
jgi:serine/threonine-protein kinase